MMSKSFAGGFVLALVSLTSAPASAIQLADGTVHFTAVPRLEGARTTDSDAGAFGATYYFTLTVPADAGEPLQRITVAQKEGVSRIRFLTRRTRAFRDQRRRQPVTLGDVSAHDKNAVTVSFDPPITPGETVMVGLRPRYNPRTDGVYLFGVTAFPAGEKSQGQFLGFGRLHFYQRHRRRSLFHYW